MAAAEETVSAGSTCSDLSRRRKTVMLTLTEACNLDCVYCFERAKTNRTMSLQVAKQAVASEFRNSDGFDEIEIDLFGGEPSLCRDLIMELVSWTDAQEFGKPYLFFMDTNGTLVHGELQEWLLRNVDHVRAGLSLDGTPETHNRNRCNSYEQIDIDFFVRTYPVQPARMTIHSDTMGSLCADVTHLHGLGFAGVVATFAHGIDWDLDAVNNVLPGELEKLCSYYLENPEVAECSIFDMSLPSVLDRSKGVGKWCGTGTSMVSYGVDGRRYPCHTFQANTVSLSKVVESGEIDFGNIGDFSDPACRGCLIEPVCPNCYGMNYVATGNILQRDRRACAVVRVRALATSFLRARQIEMGLTQMKPGEVFRNIKAIKAIQSELSTIQTWKG